MSSHIAHVSVLRTDRDDRFLEGSACAIRVAFESVDNQSRSVGDDDLDAALVDGPLEPPSAEARVFLAQLLGVLAQRGNALRLDAGIASWKPISALSDEAIGTAGLTRDLNVALDDIGTYAPVLVWATPHAVARRANSLIQTFLRSPEDRSVWRQILALGSMRASFDGEVCSVSLDCSLIEPGASAIRETLTRSNILAHWHR